MENIKQQLFEDNKITAEQGEQLEAFVRLFEVYNAHTNLSAVRQTDDIWLKHIADSLRLLDFEVLEGKVLDIGTGGGLPGIPLAIVAPEAEFTLLDSVGKKVRACEHFVNELGLRNVKVAQGRAEQIGQQTDYAGKFNMVVSRATAYLPTILAWSEPFMKSKGKIILYKTPSSGELVDGNNAAKRLQLNPQATHVYQLAGQERQLLVYVRK